MNRKYVVKLVKYNVQKFQMAKTRDQPMSKPLKNSRIRDKIRLISSVLIFFDFQLTRAELAGLSAHLRPC